MATAHLSAQQHRAVAAIVNRSTRADGVAPLNESGILATEPDIGHPRLHELVLDTSTLVGYAQLDPRDNSVQLVVDPQHRRRGHGLALAQAVQPLGPRSWWAFGNTPGAQALAAKLGLREVRTLLIMERDLGRPEPEPVPAGFTIGSWAADPAPREQIIADLVAVNAAAFAHHPEQGSMSVADVAAKLTQPWSDPAGLLLARDDQGRLAGFHWTKITADPNHPEGPPLGEVYIIGVRPDANGHGLGRALLSAGLDLMRERGVQRVHLYVDSDQERVVRMYDSASFGVINRDVSYAR